MIDPTVGKPLLVSEWMANLESAVPFHELRFLLSEPSRFSANASSNYCPQAFKPYQSYIDDLLKTFGDDVPKFVPRQR